MQCMQGSLQQATLNADSRRGVNTCIAHRVHVWVSFYGNAGDTNIEINGHIHRLGSFSFILRCVCFLAADLHAQFSVTSRVLSTREPEIRNLLR